MHYFLDKIYCVVYFLTLSCVVFSLSVLRLFGSSIIVCGILATVFMLGYAISDLRVSGVKLLKIILPFICAVVFLGYLSVWIDAVYTIALLVALLVFELYVLVYSNFYYKILDTSSVLDTIKQFNNLEYIHDRVNYALLLLDTKCDIRYGCIDILSMYSVSSMEDFAVRLDCLIKSCNIFVNSKSMDFVNSIRIVSVTSHVLSGLSAQDTLVYLCLAYIAGNIQEPVIEDYSVIKSLCESFTICKPVFIGCISEKNFA